MSIDLTISTNYKNDYTLVLLKGVLDLYTSAEFVRGLYDNETTQHRTILLDFKELQFVDTHGIGTLVQSYKTLAEKGISIKILSASSSIKKALELAGFHKLGIPIYDSLDMAFTIKPKKGDQ